LALFPHRFASDPRDAPQWPELQEAAADLLDERAAMPPPGAVESLFSQLDRCTLLDIAGRRAEARAVLDAAAFESSGCIECEADQRLVLDQRRSELCERDGELQRALTLQLGACFDCESNPFAPAPGDDLLHARCGLLLCLAGHVEEGELLLRAVLSAYPGSPGAHFAGEELSRRGVPPDAPRVFLFGARGVLAVGTADQPGVVRWIAADVSPRISHVAAHALATDGAVARDREIAVLDPPAFEGVRDRFDRLRLPLHLAYAGVDLTLLQGLAGGARPYVEALVTYGGTPLTFDAPDPDPAGWLLRLRGEVDLGEHPLFFSSREFTAAWRAWSESILAGRSELDMEFTALGELLAELGPPFRTTTMFTIPNPGSVLAARLALFAHRFGLDPRQAPQWPAFEGVARELLAAHRSALPVLDDGTFNVAGPLDRYLLLDICHEEKEARSVLAVMSVDSIDEDVLHVVEHGVEVHQRRSELAERDGDTVLALHHQQEACMDLAIIAGVLGDPTFRGRDLLLLRYGLLLRAAGHEGEGILMLQALTTMHPDSIGATEARKELERIGATAGAGSARFLCDSWNSFGYTADSFVTLALARDDWPEVCWLAARVPALEGPRTLRSVQFDGAGFESARPHLEILLAGGGHAQCSRALMLLQGLEGGARRYVPHILGRYRGSELGSLDTVLRWLHGGGPDATASTADAWRDWLEER
jgi:hypothetical protein